MWVCSYQKIPIMTRDYISRDSKLYIFSDGFKIYFLKFQETKLS